MSARYISTRMLGRYKEKEEPDPIFLAPFVSFPAFEMAGCIGWRYDLLKKRWQPYFFSAKCGWVSFSFMSEPD